MAQVGRKKLDGKECRWIIPHDIYQIVKRRGKAYIWDAVRFKDTLDTMKDERR